MIVCKLIVNLLQMKLALVYCAVVVVCLLVDGAQSQYTGGAGGGGDRRIIGGRRRFVVGRAWQPRPPQGINAGLQHNPMGVNA